MPKRKPKETAPPVVRRGRPPTGETPKRILRCDDERWESYRAAADRAGKNLSAWIRDTLDKAAKK